MICVSAVVGCLQSPSAVFMLFCWHCLVIVALPADELSPKLVAPTTSFTPVLVMVAFAAVEVFLNTRSAPRLLKLVRFPAVALFLNVIAPTRNELISLVITKFCMTPELFVMPRPQG